MNDIDIRVLQKNLEDAMYAIADAQSQIRASLWLLEKEKRKSDEETERASTPARG